jgi:sugar-specific transcriptional regulator TrmB
LNQEKLLKTLVNLGFTQLEAETYFHFAKNGSTKALDATKALRISKQRLYPVIKSLQSKGIMNATLERPARFSVVPFEKVLDLFVNAKMAEAQNVQQNKAGFLLDWQSMAIAHSDSSTGKFTVIQGRNYIYSKIQQMIQETKTHLSFVATVSSLARADGFGLLDAAFNHPLRSKIQFRFLTELSIQNVEAMKKLLKKQPKICFNLNGKVPDIGLKLCPRMIIRDEDETVFFLDPTRDALLNENDDLCLWTNSKSLVSAFLTMFEDLWRNSSDIEKKIVQIETGELSLQTSVVQDTDSVATNRKHIDTLMSAYREIIMITSSESLPAFWKNKTFSQKLLERGVSVRIMVPITIKNFRVAKQLTKFVEVRHIPPSYLETTVVDGEHLFQFKNPCLVNNKLGKSPHYPETFYTNDIEHTEKIVERLNDIWKNTQPQFPANFESINEPFCLMPPPLLNGHSGNIKDAEYFEVKQGTINEKDVLKKIINGGKTSDGGSGRMYATSAVALIHPPEKFNLPDMLIRIYQIDKRSRFGEEDTLSVYLWLETPEGHAFCPAGDIGDNPVGVTRRKESTFRYSPAKENCRLVKKDEIQIRVYGNSLFCGWTVPIQLHPFKYVLPPACLMVEGYGKVKTRAYSIISSTGFNFLVEKNYFDAFVTFMHPNSKYSGPGTDGAFLRDLIVTTTPPKN